MPTRWVESVRISGRIDLFLDGSLGRGWRQIVSDAVQAFNTIAERERLG